MEPNQCTLTLVDTKITFKNGKFKARLEYINMGVCRNWVVNSTKRQTESVTIEESDWI